MAKYTSTPMDFFLRLSWKEGMAYFIDVSQMIQEERDQIESSSKATSFDASALQKWRGSIAQ